MALVSRLWAGSVVTPIIVVADGYVTAGSAFGLFVWVALIFFVLLTLGYGPASWKEGIIVFCCIIIWPLTLPVLLVLMQRQWPDRYAERYHRRYVAPATDFDEAATALWSRAVETGTVLGGPAGRDAPQAVSPRIWAIAELLARSSLPSELDRRSALLDDAGRQVDLLGQ